MSELVVSLSALAGTADASPAVDAHLRMIANLVPATVGPVDSASVTVVRGGVFATLATSDELAARLDAAQYSQSGPCMAALDNGAPVAVPGTTAGTEWPQFREQARSVGLYASLSIPLFVGSGAVVASLNLYARDPAAMMPLITRVVELYQHDPLPYPRTQERLSDGGEHLIDGLAAALDVHDDIQHALGVLMGAGQLSAPDAYNALQQLADTHGTALHTAAIDLLHRLEA